MMRTAFFLRTGLAAAGVLIGVFSAGFPVAFAKDAYPPGWNVKSDVPPSTASTWIGGWHTNLPYWADQKWPDGRIPSRYSTDQCHWDWCKAMVQKPATATAAVPQAK
jgi:hypothetical protein